METSTIFRGLRIVEVSSVLAGPAVGMFFAELGAEVIKIENPHTGGDMTRHWKLPAEAPDAPESAYYKSVNWGKQSRFLDLAAAEGREQAYALIREADVLLTNFTRRAAGKLGLSPETTGRLNPALIHANLTAYGEADDRPGFDVLLQAETGFLHMTGHPGAPPAKMPVALIDILAAHQLKEGILIALLERSRSGKGAYLSVSLFGSALASLANQASNYLNTGYVPGPLGTEHPNIAPYGDLCTTADGERIVLAVGTETQFRNLCAALDMPRLTDKPEFADNASRVAHRADLMKTLREAISTWPSAELLDRFRAGGVPAGKVADLKTVFEQPAARAMVLSYPDGGKCVRTVSFEMVTFE